MSDIASIRYMVGRKIETHIESRTDAQCQSPTHRKQQTSAYAHTPIIEIVGA